MIIGKVIHNVLIKKRLANVLMRAGIELSWLHCHFPFACNIWIKISWLPLPEKNTVSIYDIRGKLVANHDNLPDASHGVSVPFSNSAGVYVIVVSSRSRLLYRGKIIAG